MTKNAVVPGEALTTEEEFLAGKNTFAEDGVVKSKTLGNANFDNNTKEVSVEGKSVETITEGDIVFGVVTNVKENTVMIELRKAEGNKKITNRNAQIPVRNISNEFVSRTRDYYRIGDIVKAQVSRIDDYGIDLETKGRGLGVIKAYCSQCRHEMLASQDKLKCLNCGSAEDRKWFEKEDLYKPRERSDSRGFDRDRGSSRGFDRGGDRRSFGNREHGPRPFGNRTYGGQGSRSFGNRDGPRQDNRSFGNRDNSSGPRRSFNSNGRNNFGGRR